MDNDGTTTITDEQIREIFSPPDMVEAEMLEEENILASIALAKNDAHFLSVSKKIRALYDRVSATPKAERASLPPEDVLASNCFKMVCYGGPSLRDGITFYQKKADKVAKSELPPWQTFIAKAAFVEAYSACNAKINDLLKNFRKEVEAQCVGLPPAVVDHRTYWELSERFQMTYVVSDERWKGKDGKEYAVSIGIRNDLFRPERKKEEEAVTPPTDKAPAPPTEAAPPPAA